MNQADATIVMDKLADLFSKWTATPAEARAWQNVFYRVDRPAAERAVQELWEQSKFNKPYPGSFVEIVAGYAPKATREEGADPVTDVWIMCMEAPEATPLLLGRILSVHLGPLGREPERQKLLSAAERMRGNYEGRYGGEWATFQGATWAEMQDNRNQLRHNAGMMTAHESKADTQRKAVANG